MCPQSMEPELYCLDKLALGLCGRKMTLFGAPVLLVFFLWAAVLWEC